MPTFIQSLLSNDELMLQLGIFSGIFFIVTLIVIPWFVLLIPPDYFMQEHRRPFLHHFENPVFRMILLVLKNLLGGCFLILGILLLVLPGQGLLTMLLGIIMTDFPGKYRLERWFVHKESIRRSINWLRDKGGREPIAIR